MRDGLCAASANMTGKIVGWGQGGECPRFLAFTRKTRGFSDAPSYDMNATFHIHTCRRPTGTRTKPSRCSPTAPSLPPPCLRMSARFPLWMTRWHPQWPLPFFSLWSPCLFSRMDALLLTPASMYAKLTLLFEVGFRDTQQLRKATFIHSH